MNRTRASSVDAFGTRDQRNRIYPALEASDGSTLSLDFTQMSSLDSRFTFTRSTTATFINSRGYVVYADHNLVQNSTMLVSTLWTSTTSGGGTVTINNNNTVTFASTAGRATWLQGITIQSGLPVTFSLEVTALTNTNMRVSDLFQAGTGFTSQVYNYTDLSGNTTTNIGAYTTLPGVGLYTVNATTTATSGNVVFGTDSNGVTRTGSVTIARPQLQYGTVVSSRVYLANSSTSAANTNTPRFDYDPTTLTARGLLIEGSATNLLKYSQGLFTNWLSAGTVGAVTTGITSPSGDSSAVSLNLNTAGNNGYYTNNTLMGYTNTVGATYTFSIWVRATGSTTNLNIRLGDSAVGYSANIPITTSWQRLQYSYVAVSASGPVITSATSTATGVVELWGAQLEAGSGATSYIPTTTSSLNRAADQLTMSNISTLGYSTAAGTFYYSGQFTQSNTAAYPVRIGFMTAGDQPTWEVFTNASRLFAAARGAGAAPEANLAFTLNTQIRFAASFDASLSTAEVKVNLNGSSTSAGPTSLSSTFTPTRLVIGRPGYEDYFPAGTIAQIKYWPTLKTAAELNLLTTT